jgi:hypothetical protein
MIYLLLDNIFDNYFERTHSYAAIIGLNQNHDIYAYDIHPAVTGITQRCTGPVYANYMKISYISYQTHP